MKNTTKEIKSKRIGKKIVATILTVVMLMSMSTGIMANGVDENGNSSNLYIPLSQLANYQTHAEKVAVCQLDEALIANMSTSELVDAVLEYPYIIDIYAFNDYATGYESVKNSFNGLQELERRSDASAVLMEKYRTAPLDREFLVFPNIEIIVSQKIFTDQLSEVQNSELIAIADVKYQQRCSMSAGEMNSAKAFYETMSTYTYVSTPRNSSVYVQIKGETLEQYEKEDHIAYFARIYPNARLLSDPTTNYNCHSYAWYWQSTSNTYWMDDPSAYMNDGSYTRRTGTSVKIGDRIFYPVDGHTAIANFSSDFNYNALRVTSKWGPGGLYEHYYLDSPYDYSSLQVYYR